MTESRDSEPPGRRLGVVILAAGQGTRMHSPTPKVLHSVAGRPMLAHVALLARQLAPTILAVVIPPDGERIAEAAGPGVEVAVQERQDGTADAIRCAQPLLDGTVDRVLMLYGDAVLLRPETLERMLAALTECPLAFLTATLDDPSGYGRVVRDSHGRVLGIIEERDATMEQRGIGEINSGIMAFDGAWLWSRLPRVPRRSHGEYYLPDLVAIAITEGTAVTAVQADSAVEVEGVNTQAQLAAANGVIWQRERQRLLESGVTITAPETVFVSPGVEVAAGAVIHPNSHLLGTTSVGPLSEVGPNSIIRNSRIGARCAVVASVLEDALVMNDVQIGPFAHLRPNAVIHDGVELGNYAEVKASRIGRNSRIHHFSYIGDAELGDDVNVGAGTITCNFDGTDKHKTVVGDGVFLGSDTLLIAPVELGPGARTGAGAVVRRDVAPGQLVVGMPARPVPGRQPQAGGDASADEGDSAPA